MGYLKIGIGVSVAGLVLGITGLVVGMLGLFSPFTQWPLDFMHLMTAMMWAFITVGWVFFGLEAARILGYFE